MKTNALSVANYFIDLAKEDNTPIRLLGLVKRVYIAHGFSLALLGHGLLDPRFDRVEAWKYGPVIPSVYHSFKQYEANPITKKTIMMRQDEHGDYKFITPVLEDEQEKAIVKLVWRRYFYNTDSQLVNLTHRKGTPWYWRYKPNENAEIPDSYTKLFYERLVKVLLDERKQN